MTIIVYSELFTPMFAPLVFYLPCFYKYGITIERLEQEMEPTKISSDDGTSMTFGYGMRGPGGLTSHTVLIHNIDHESIIVGNASAMENFLRFGGWGIRMGYSNGRFTWGYNASNGPYVEFDEITNKDKGRSTRYRIASKDAERVASILKEGSTRTSSGGRKEEDEEKEKVESNPLLDTAVKSYS